MCRWAWLAPLSSSWTGAEGAATVWMVPAEARVGLTLEVKCWPPPYNSLARTWSHELTQPGSAHPFMCPESRKPEIVGENMTTTVCPSNHQKCDSHLPSRQNILTAPLPTTTSKGVDPNIPSVVILSWKSRISG